MTIRVKGNAIVVERATVRVATRHLGTVTVRTPAYAAERLLSAVAWRSADRAEFDKAFGMCIEPRVRASDMRRVPKRDRARLMAAIIALRGGDALRDWRSLYGSCLGPEERFVLVSRRELERARRRILAIARRDDGASRINLCPQPNRAWTMQEVARIPIAPGIVRFDDRVYDAVAGLVKMSELQVGPQASVANSISPILSSTLQSSPLFSGLAAMRADIGRSCAAAVSQVAAAAGAITASTAPLLRISQEFKRVDFAASTALGRGATRAEGLGCFEHIRDAIASFQESFGPVAAFIDAWEKHALWFVFAEVEMGALRQLSDIERDEIPELILDAIELVIGHTAFLPDLEAAIAGDIRLGRRASAWLPTAIRHIAAREYLDAVPSLLLGLEGAFVGEALHRRLPLGRRKKLPPSNILINALTTDEELSRFVSRGVYSGVGHAARHGHDGEAEDDRALCLLGVIALAGWADHFIGTELMERSGDALGAALVYAAETHRQAQVPQIAAS